MKTKVEQAPRQKRGRRRSWPPTWLRIGEACKPLARKLARSGGQLTLEAMATEAQVSRRTAERYSELVRSYLQAQLKVQIHRGPQGFYIQRLEAPKNTLPKREPPLNPPIVIVGGEQCFPCIVSIPAPGGFDQDQRSPPHRVDQGQRRGRGPPP